PPRSCRSSGPGGPGDAHSLSARSYHLTAAFRRGGPLDRPDDRRVAGAAAELPRDRVADLLLRRVRLAVEQCPGGHHHAGRTEAALQPVALHESTLDSVEL